MTKQFVVKQTVAYLSALTLLVLGVVIGFAISPSNSQHVQAKDSSKSSQHTGTVPNQPVNTPQHGGPVDAYPAVGTVKNGVKAEQGPNNSYGVPTVAYQCADGMGHFLVPTGKSVEYNGTNVTTESDEGVYKQPQGVDFIDRGQNYVVVAFGRLSPAFQPASVIVHSADEAFGLNPDGSPNSNDVLNSGNEDDHVVNVTSDMLQHGGLKLATSDFTSGAILELTFCMLQK